MDIVAFWSIEIRVNGKEVDFGRLDAMAKGEIITAIKSGIRRGNVYTTEFDMEED